MEVSTSWQSCQCPGPLPVPGDRATLCKRLPGCPLRFPCELRAGTVPRKVVNGGRALGREASRCSTHVTCTQGKSLHEGTSCPFLGYTAVPNILAGPQHIQRVPRVARGWRTPSRKAALPFRVVGFSLGNQRQQLAWAELPPTGPHGAVAPPLLYLPAGRTGAKERNLPGHR